MFLGNMKRKQLTLDGKPPKNKTGYEKRDRS